MEGHLYFQEEKHNAGLIKDLIIQAALWNMDPCSKMCCLYFLRFFADFTSQLRAKMKMWKLFGEQLTFGTSLRKQPID